MANDDQPLDTFSGEDTETWHLTIPSYDHYLTTRRFTDTYAFLDGFYTHRIGGRGGVDDMAVPFLLALINEAVLQGGVVDDRLLHVTGAILGMWREHVSKNPSTRDNNNNNNNNNNNSNPFLRGGDRLEERPVRQQQQPPMTPPRSTTRETGRPVSVYDQVLLAEEDMVELPDI